MLLLAILILIALDITSTIEKHYYYNVSGGAVGSVLTAPGSWFNPEPKLLPMCVSSGFFSSLYL